MALALIQQSRLTEEISHGLLFTFTKQRSLELLDARLHDTIEIKPFNLYTISRNIYWIKNYRLQNTKEIYIEL